MGISHLENGDRKIKIEDLQKIADVLSRDMSYLIEPIMKPSFPSTFYRRGDDDINDEQKKAEHEAMRKLDELIKNEN